ncbi:hypothetical protein BDQ12DRAFT_670188 [Crucibulum laeve]|uniref:Uncharacterized protein n=1 Tax=Crucibulum laeve TaxID=68775 RepID=A0A5C3LXI5_9AGAR|nr:hypothetical protein BDQ12DRAFT_670188 [Crucibulum laeve]
MDRSFRTALKCEPPRDKDLKFIPKILIDENSINWWAKIRGFREIVEACKSMVLQGKFKDNEIFNGLVEAMVTYKDKETHGVGFQNFKYAPGVMEFAQIINIHSPRAYRAVHKVLQLPTACSNQINRAREPRFPIGIQPEMFSRIVSHLETMDYHGPLGLACDDTQLLAALRPYHDKETGQHYLLGRTGGPMLLAQPEEFEKLLDQGMVEKASKLRLWCLQVPMPEIPTIIAAAKAISNSLTADDLYVDLERLLDGLFQHGLKVISYAADGSSVERAIQRKLDQACKARRTLFISHPSGARMLTLGNYVVLYGHLRRLSTEGGPLFNRDVIKVDRQDDSAAIRLFSANVLQWLIENYPQLLVPIIYLFVLGELIDAYQNQHINHLERVKMVLRTLFFMEIWEEFIDEAAYPKAKHFLSKEACDIVQYLIYGFLTLIVIFRDHLPEIYPLLPWLLSTEPYGKERASGYTHNYHDIRGIDINALSTFPSNHEIQDAATTAYHEAENLWLLLGYCPVAYDDKAGSTVTKLPSISAWFTAKSHCPPIRPNDSATCYNAVDAEAVDSDYDSDVDVEYQHGNNPSEAALVLEAMEKAERFGNLSFVEEDEINRLSFAAISLSINDSLRIHELPELNGDQLQQSLRKEHSSIAYTLGHCLPAVVMPEERCTVLDISGNEMLDFSTLINLRKDHQRLQAATGTRKPQKSTTAGVVVSYFSDPMSASSTSDAPSTSETKLSRQELLRQFNAVIKAQEDRGVATAVGCRKPTPVTGNSANAAEVSAKDNQKLLNKRMRSFGKYQRLPRELRNARVTVLSPLTFFNDGKPLKEPILNGSWYGFVFVDGKIAIARGDYSSWLIGGIHGANIFSVLSLYSKSGGMNGKHGWVPQVTTITSASNIAVQLYQNVSRSRFRTFQSAGKNNIQIKKYGLISGVQFLCILAAAPKLFNDETFLEISESDIGMYGSLTISKEHISAAIKIFKGRKYDETDEVGEDD